MWGRMSLPARLRDDLAQYDEMVCCSHWSCFIRWLLLYPLILNGVGSNKKRQVAFLSTQARRFSACCRGMLPIYTLIKRGSNFIPAPLRRVLLYYDKVNISWSRQKNLEFWSQEEGRLSADYLYQMRLRTYKLKPCGNFFMTKRRMGELNVMLDEFVDMLGNRTEMRLYVDGTFGVGGPPARLVFRKRLEAGRLGWFDKGFRGDRMVKLLQQMRIHDFDCPDSFAKYWVGNSDVLCS